MNENIKELYTEIYADLWTKWRNAIESQCGWDFSWNAGKQINIRALIITQRLKQMINFQLLETLNDYGRNKNI